MCYNGTWVALCVDIQAQSVWWQRGYSVLDYRIESCLRDFLHSTWTTAHTFEARRATTPGLGLCSPLLDFSIRHS